MFVYVEIAWTDNRRFDQYEMDFRMFPLKEPEKIRIELRRVIQEEDFVERGEILHVDRRYLMAELAQLFRQVDHEKEKFLPDVRRTVREHSILVVETVEVPESNFHRASAGAGQNFSGRVDFAMRSHIHGGFRSGTWSR
jgi:hypothetical protein